MNIKYRKVRPDATAPVRASDGAVGYDVFASVILDKWTKKVSGYLPVTILPGKSILIGIGIQMAVPFPVDCEVRPRSGLATKHDIELSNSPGTIDPDFRGEAGVLLRNRGEGPYTVQAKERIAQLVFKKVEIPILEETGELPPTKRGELGFGGTGYTGLGLGVEDYMESIRVADRYYMSIVLAVSENSTCVRGVKRINGAYERNEAGRFIGQTRKFGCIVVKDNNIIAHGFNAQRPGPKCSEVGCQRDELNIPSGTQIEKCRARHAEWWALTNALRAGSPSTQGATLYVNAEPCEICASIISDVGIKDIVLLKGVYPTNGLKIISDAGINIRYVKI